MSFINPTPVSAYSATLSASDSITLNVTPAGDGTAIQADSINVVSDCRAGYNLTIATPEGSSLYLDGDDTNEASFTAVDGTNTLSSNNNANKWGYTLVNNPTSATVFSPLSATASVLKTTSETASPSNDIDDDIDIYYGVKTAPTTAPGSYQMANSGAIVYYLTMDFSCTHYAVSFNANGGTGVIDDQIIQSGEATKLASAEDITPPTTTDYTDADDNTVTGVADKLWTFWGWNTEVDGSGDWYKDEEEVVDLGEANTTTVLYAQWKQATIMDLTVGVQVASEKVINHNTMQDMNPAICYNSTAYSKNTSSDANTPYDASANPNGYHTITLLDYRGKITTGNNPENPEQYTIAKLADNACWMTSDLHLGSTARTVTLTSEDTDTTNDFILPVVETSSTKTQWGTMDETTGLDVAHAYQYNNTRNVYNWYTATAGTTYASASATTSICPKNWKLLTKNRAEGYLSALGVTTNSTNTAILTNSPFNIAGGYYNSATQTAYSNKVYWTANGWRNSSTGVYFGYYFGIATSSGTSYVRTTYGYQKMMGLGVRCVATMGEITINYNGNDNTGGTTANQQNVDINSTNIRENGFTRTNYRFSGWNTEPDGSGVAVSAGASVSSLGLKPNETVVLYAQWVPQYIVTYVNNCKSWVSGNAECTDDASTTTLEKRTDLRPNGSANVAVQIWSTFTLSGWKIKEWTENADGTGNTYQVGTSFSVTDASAGDGVTLYAHWVQVYAVQYDGNGSDNDSTGMGTIDNTTGLKTVHHENIGEGDFYGLFASNFKRAGYGFVGWSYDADAWNKFIDNDVNNDARIYGPNERMYAPAYGGSPIVTLYAVWAPAEKDGNNNPIYLQNWDGCSAMTATTYNSTTRRFMISKNGIKALTDQRDNQVYTVAKLTDGNCWIVENLRLDNSPELSTTNTNIFTNDNTLPITNEYGGGTSNYLSASSSSWCTGTGADCINQSRLNTVNTTANITPSKTQNVASYTYVSFSDSTYSYGNYYNWYSATAGYGVHSSTASPSTVGDICPAGWRLPYGGATDSASSYGNTKGGFYYLGNQMDAIDNEQNSANRFRTFPNNFVLSGVWRGESSSSRGSLGYYWTSSSNNSNGVSTLLLGTTSLFPGNISTTSNKGSGYSVRCVADMPYTVTVNFDSHVQSVSFTDQDNNTQTVNTSGGTVTLMYRRDYTVSGTYDSGYAFNYWDTSGDITVAETSNSPSILNGTGAGTLSLYSAVTIATATYLQEVTACPGNLTIGQIYTLTDSRDQQQYNVARLADGKCWMLDNLALDLADDTVLSNVTADNTNIDTVNDPGALAALKGITPGTASDKYATSKASSNWNNSYSYSDPLIDMSSKNIVPSDSVSTSGGYKVGGYYNLCAASAGSHCYGDGTSQGTSPGDVTSSICPKSWRLPTGDSVGEYGYLAKAIIGSNSNSYDVTKIANFRNALHIPLSGGVYEGDVEGRGENAWFWSSTDKIGTLIVSLGLSEDFLQTYTNIYPEMGNSIRCVLNT